MTSRERRYIVPPQRFRNQVDRDASSEFTVQLTGGIWPLGPRASLLRRASFIKEQSIDADQMI
jgi:hypothetical protein